MDDSFCSDMENDVESSFEVRPPCVREARFAVVPRRAVTDSDSRAALYFDARVVSVLTRPQKPQPRACVTAALLWHGRR